MSMLGRKSKKNQEKNVQTVNPSLSGQSLNCVVAKGTTIDGNIKCQDNVRLDGLLKGDLDSNAQVVLGIDGEIQGNVKSVKARIDGTIKGNMDISELLVLGSTARIFGDIKATSMQVEEGAIFNGNSKIGK